MLKLLLDEHISPDVAIGLRSRNRAVEIHCTFWDRKTPLVCAKLPPRGLTLVTSDRRTIPRLLKTWAEEELTHGGVFF
jgi:hypothetical protein